MNSKPLIIVTGPNTGGFFAWIFTALNIIIAGGRPKRITPETDQTKVCFDGLILGGGSDINPDSFAEEKIVYKDPVTRNCKNKLHELVVYPFEALNNFMKSDKSKYDTARDSMELKYLNQALVNKVPVLGICRGHQLVNTSLGGTLHNSTRPYYKNKPRIRSIFPRKKVFFNNENSMMFQINRFHSIRVNALHNQAVADIAPELKIAAKEANGIVQSLENSEKKIITVQWHPEYLIYKKDQRALFNWLVGKARQ